jgi:molybdate transport system permease protein
MPQSTTQVVAFTIWACLLSTLLILPAGILLGWFLARRRFIGKSLLETLLALPLVMPPVATGLILLKLLGRRGFFGSFFENWLDVQIVFTWRAVVVAAAVMSFPLLLRSTIVAFQEVDLRLERVARTLGANDLRVFFTITLPLASRGILSGIVLSFARALGEFGATILVAGNIPGKTSTLSLTIYQAVQLGQDPIAYRLLGISMLIAFIALWSSELILRRGRRAP